MAVKDQWVQYGEWYIRKPDGEGLNLNTLAGAEYVLYLQRQVRRLESDTERRRGQQRAKPGPSENKQGA